MSSPTPTEEFTVPVDPERLISWLDKKRASGKGTVPDLQLRTNLAFLLGHQWIVWDSRSARFRRPGQHRGDPNAPVRITANKIAGLAERSIAKLTKSAPAPEARPVSDSEDDIAAAKVATRILDHELYREDWESFLTDFYFWPVTLGWSYTHIWWDPKAGDEVGSVMDNGEVQTAFKGEMRLEEVPAFELSVDPNAKKFRTALWANRTTAMTREAVWERWGKVPAGTDGGRSLADDVYALSADDGSNPARREQASGEFIKVHQFWLRPGGRAAPKGMVVTWAGKTILEGPSPFPYDHGQLPFVQWDLLPGVGTREGRTWVTDLISLQVDYNDARSREATIRRTLTPKILAPTGSIDPRRLTSRVEVIDYAPTGAAPTWSIPDSGWMAQYEAGMQRADQEMGDRAGQQDVSAGKAPSASMPAAAILALQEADDTRLAISAKKLASGIRETGWQILQLVRQFWTEERVVRTWSADGDLEVQKFQGADVAKSLDIHVSAESALPKSKSARTQLAMELLDRGIISDPRLIMRLIDIPGTDFLVESINKDVRQAHRENGSLRRGEQIPVQHFHAHEIHLPEHYGEMKEEWYEQAQPTDPAKIAFDAHVAVHEQVLAAKAMGVAPPPDGAGAPGAPAGAGGPAYLDPLTGKPPDPTSVAAGQTPSGLAFGPQNIRKAAGIGGPGQPGAVPGISADQQAASTGQ